jgi:histidinol-phosphate aminotransferase
MIARVHGDAYAAPGLLDFAVNVWPQDRPRFLQDAMAAASREDRYPDDRAARAAVAARHGRPTSEVLVTNGACEALWLVAGVLRPRRAACIHPAFAEAEAALCCAGATVARVQRESERWSFDPAAVPDEAEVVVVTNPNNPTGTLDSRDAIRTLLRPGRLVVVDESFMDFVAGERESLTGERRDGLVVVRSLTKAWALPGIRAGYLLGPAALVATLGAHRQPWSVNAVALAAIAACAGRTEATAAIARDVADARAALTARLEGLPGVRTWPSAANFLLLRVPDGPAAVAALHDAGIAVRPAGSFPGLDEDHIRVAIRRPDECETLAAALAEAVA